MNLLEYIFRYSRVIEKTQQAALDTLPIGVIILDKNRRFLYANETFRRLFQDSRTFPRNPSGIQILEGLWRLGQKHQIRGLFPIVKVPKELQFKGRTFREVFYHLSQKNGLPECFVGLFEDITEQKEEQAYFQEAQRLASLSQLLGGIAHEFNNPLAVVKTHAELLREHIEPGGEGSLEVIERNVEKLASILATVRSIFQQESTGVGPVALGEVLSAVTQSLDEQLKKMGISMKVRVAPDLAPVKIQKEKARQLFLQLLLNAMQAIKKRRIKGGRITLQLDSKGRHGILLKCQDNGVGISEKNRHRIFDPFFTTQDVGKGMGIGLTLVQTIAHELGGSVSVQSQQRNGTTFYVRIPKRNVRGMAKETPPLPAAAEGHEPAREGRRTGVSSEALASRYRTTHNGDVKHNGDVRGIVPRPFVGLHRKGSLDESKKSLNR